MPARVDSGLVTYPPAVGGIGYDNLSPLENAGPVDYAIVCLDSSTDGSLQQRFRR